MPETIERKRRKRGYDTDQMSAATARMIRAVGRRVAWDDPEQLAHLKQLQDELDAAWRVAIDGLRGHQFSDRMIGEALGVSQPAVTMKWRRDRTEQR
jgi:hypothetical protein